jgi:hypothetical protein
VDPNIVNDNGGGGDHGNIWDTNENIRDTDDNIKDTDRLADYLDIHKKGPNDPKMKFIKDTGIKLSTNKSYLKRRQDYQEDLSRIARFVNERYPGKVFDQYTPQYTPIVDTIVKEVRNIHENVPKEFK